MFFQNVTHSPVPSAMIFVGTRYIASAPLNILSLAILAQNRPLPLPKLRPPGVLWAKCQDSTDDICDK
ncbi:MAG: hypothetical protein H0X30_23115 [Anaerolineae bacterium]|nr:hypothetical protein [Anaerolineae bacterium]